MRESQTNYDEYMLDVCLEDGQPATTFTIAKSSDGTWGFAGLDCNPSTRVRQLLSTHSNWTDLGIHGFELKECLPSSENGTFVHMAIFLLFLIIFAILSILLNFFLF